MSTLTKSKTAVRRLDPENWLENHGEYLYRYALYRVDRSQIAEDLVSDTFMAGIRAQSRFEGRASERTWLVSILKNKIADYFRKKNRERTFTDLGFEYDGDEDRMVSGNWKTGVPAKNWAPRPGDSIEKRENWESLQGCIDKLPKRMAEIFRLREVEEVSTEEICRDFDISPNNLWVIIHRARAILRSCLEEGYCELRV